MRTTSSRTGPAGAPSIAYLPATLKRFYGPVVVALLLALWPARAESPDDQYLRVYGLMEQAEALETKGETGQALTTYRQAQATLQSFQRSNPGWNPKLVNYRFNYLAQKVAALSGASPAPAATSAPASKQKAKSDSKPTTPASDSQVKLLGAGAEPRKELRLHPKAGDKQTAAMTIKLTLDTTIGEMPSQAVKLPAIKMTSEVTVKSVSEDGDITSEMVISEVSVADEPGSMPQVVEPLKAALGGIKGLSGTGTISSRGVSKGIEMKIPANADAQTRQVMDQMKEAFANLAVPLPKEAVGPGAKWEARMPVKSQGMTIDQSATYELVSLDSERLVVKSTLTQRAANQKIQSPTMPGLKLNLTKMVGKGTGSTTFDLAQLLPLERTVDLHADQSLTMDAGGQPQAITVKTDMNFRSEAK
jgi:hypothetical protein